MIVVIENPLIPVLLLDISPPFLYEKHKYFPKCYLEKRKAFQCCTFFGSFRLIWLCNRSFCHVSYLESTLTQHAHLLTLTLTQHTLPAPSRVFYIKITQIHKHPFTHTKTPLLLIRTTRQKKKSQKQN